MKQRSISIQEATRQLVKKIAEQEIYGWPPVCVALCYQPVRPKTKKEEAAQPSSEQYVEKL